MLKKSLVKAQKWGSTKKWAETLKRFGKDESGNIVILGSMAAGVLIFGGAVAVDTAEMYRAKVNFQYAVDSATLAAAKEMAATGNSVAAEAAGEAMFYSNMENLKTPGGDATISFNFGPNNNCQDSGVISDASMYHPVFFEAIHKIGAISGRAGYASLPATATVECAAPRLEIAMVLDNSTSMGEGNRMGTLIDASTNLVETLFTTMNEPASAERIKFSVVPFAGMVNVGSQNASEPWMDVDGRSPIHHTILGNEKIFDWDGDPAVSRIGDIYRNTRNGQTMTRFRLFENIENVDWGGCVVKRPHPHHTRDTTPSQTNPETLFVPSFAPDTPDNWNNRRKYRFQTSYGNKRTCNFWEASSSSDSERNCVRWTDYHYGVSHPQNPSYVPSYNDGIEYQNGNYIGASVSGTVSNYQQTNYRARERRYNNNYLADDFNFPTDAELGVGQAHPLLDKYVGDNQHVRQSWGWKYRRTATGQRPYAENVDWYYFSDKDRLPNIANLPGGPNLGCTTQPVTDLTKNEDDVVAALQAMEPLGATDVTHGLAWGWRTLSPQEPFTNGREYNTPDNRKVIILMSDGNNTYYPANYFVSSRSRRNRSVYGAYEFTSNRRIFDGYTTTANPSHSLGTFTAAMNSHLSETCTNVKNSGVLIYSIAFGLPEGASVKEELEQCATLTESGERLYFDAADNQGLNQAFSDIATKLAKLRLTK